MAQFWVELGKDFHLQEGPYYKILCQIFGPKLGDFQADLGSKNSRGVLENFSLFLLDGCAGCLSRGFGGQIFREIEFIVLCRLVWGLLLFSFFLI